MAQVINTNIMSLNAQRNLNTTTASLASSVQRLSSGLRINSAKDDAAGLAISERFSTQIRGLDVAARNANDGISLAQTTEGALTEISNNLQRIRELAVQSRNATNSASDREALNAEVEQLKAEIQRVAEHTEFNGSKLLDGTFKNAVFQIGANQGQTITVPSLVNANTKSLGTWTNPVYGGKVAITEKMTITDGTAKASMTINGTKVEIEAKTGRSADDAKKELIAAFDKAKKEGDANLANVSIMGDKIASTADLKISDLVNTGGLEAKTFTAATPDAAATTAAVTFTDSAKAASIEINGIKLEIAEATGRDAAGALTALEAALTAAKAAEPGKTKLDGVSIKDGKITSSKDLTIGDMDNMGGVAKGGIKATPTTIMNVNGFGAETVKTAEAADAMILAMDAALNSVNSARAELGAIQNRFSSVVANLNSTSENLSASRSRIRDTDYAKETAELTRTQILQQAGTAMLAQAKSMPQSVLSLLQ